MDSTNLKQCWQCGELKSFASFKKHGATRDGYDRRCQDCAGCPIRWSGIKRSMLQCAICRTLKPIEEYADDGRLRGGLVPYCRECKKRERAMRYEADRDRAKDEARLRRYGLSGDEYRTLAARQDNRCAICGTRASENRRGRGTRGALTVDHDHETGLIRGLLCSPCNTGIGGLRHNQDLLRQAIAYLADPPALTSEQC